MKKSIIAVIAVSFAAFLSVPAAAETFTSSDGVISIELPNENWKEIEDSNKWIALSDGGNVLTIDHFSNGENLPEMTVADEHYVNTYQAVFTTQNEVFIITGYVVDPEKTPEISNMIISAKVLKYDTKTAIKKEATSSASEFSISPVDKTMYVTTDGLNVRTGCSTDEKILGAFEYGASVHVTGIVQKNGADYGWYQVSYGGGTGYVSANFLSDSAPENKQGKDSTSDKASYTGSVKTVYDESGASFALYEGMDGLWYDKDGTAYTRLTDYEFQVYEGNKHVFTYDITQITNDYVPGDEDTSGVGADSQSVTAYDENGDAVTLYSARDGFWYDEDGTAYTRHSATDFQVYEGNKHLTVY